MAPGCIFQIFLRVTVQNQIRIAKRVIVDKEVQFRLLCHSHIQCIWKNQNGLCYHCGMPMDVTEEREIFYLAPKAKTGTEDVRNMRYVHCSCQRIYAENRLKK